MKKFVVPSVAVLLFGVFYFLLTYLDLQLMIFSKILATYAICSFVLFKINNVKLVKQPSKVNK